MENHFKYIYCYANSNLNFQKKEEKALDNILKNMTKKDVKNLYAKEYKGVPKGPWVFRITEYCSNNRK